MKCRIIFKRFLFIIVVIPVLVFTQNPVVRHFTGEEDLPGNDVYDILQAKSGYLWFATDHGVSRYDGRDFSNFYRQDGLPVNSTIKIYEDIFGRIWFLAYNGMLSYYYDGEISAYPYNDTIIKYFPDNYIPKILIDSSGGILFSPRKGGNAYISSRGILHTIKAPILGKEDSTCLAFEDLGTDYFLTIRNDLPKRCSHNGQLFWLDDSYFIKLAFSHREFQRNYLKTVEGEYLVSYRSMVFVIKNHKIIAQRSFSEEVLSLYQDENERIWLSIKYDHGVYVYDNVRLDGDPDHYFEGYTITAVKQDWEGDYWFCTEGHGAFFVPTFDFNLFPILKDKGLNVMTFDISGNRLWFSTRDKELYSGRLSNGRINSIRRTDIGEPMGWMQNITVDGEGYLWISSTEYLRYDPAGFPRPPEMVVSVGCLAKTKTDSVYAADNSISIYYGSKKVFDLPLNTDKRIYSLFPEGPNKVWLGTLFGLYVFNGRYMIFKGTVNPALSERINCIAKMNDLLVVGTASHGLVMYTGDSIKYLFNESNGLSGNFVKSLFVQNDSILWVGTKSGLSKIIFRNPEQDYLIETYTESDGLPSKEINKIGMHDGYIWLATNKGLVSFLPGNITPHKIPPMIKIISVHINGRDTVLADEYRLGHDMNDIRINFSGISFREGEHLRYRYMLSNYNDEILFTKNDWVNFTNLPPGDYTFFVNVGNIHGIWNEAPRIIRFHISKHFTETTWFMIVVIFCSLLLLAGIAIFLRRQQMVRERARNELIRMEHKMFGLQMNPHFVFNSLLAIQGFMYQNNPKDAGRYLTAFAKLIRHTLYGSSEDYIILSEEIEAMQYYLDLQRLRYNEQFEYEIKMGDGLLPENLKIPPLLIQPFLENAIEHGLQYKSNGGKLMLSFMYHHDCLKIEVEDNGIGREKSREMQAETGRLHKSFGLEIVRKRINSLNKLIGQKIWLEIVDLKDDDGKGCGTLVQICIPYKSM